MKPVKLILFFLLISLFAKAQYISEIIEYTPAPGQFINTTYGNPDAAQSITGGINGTVSLGAFGGYIVFKFENPVLNDPDNPYGIDFTVFGNPASSSSAEPGTVSVMKDENNNGLPDDTWFELAGSDYFFSSTIHNYEITYSNPQESSAADVPWTDNLGNSGFVFANDFHTQAYYPLSSNFPDINQTQYTLTGSKIKGNIDKTDPSLIKSYRRAFGYADNQLRGDINSTIPDNPYTQEIEGTGGDAFDISWAVDENGNYVDLDKVDFIKIHCSVNADMAWLGELSTEISGAVDIAPDASINGTEDMVVIEDLPPIIYVGTAYQLHGFVFNKGRLQNNSDLIWSSDLSGSTVDANNILTVSQAGNLTVTATLSDNPNISYSISAKVSYPEKLTVLNDENIKIYPNPADKYLKISRIKNANIEISDISGCTKIKIPNYFKNTPIDVSDLKPGIYFIKIKNEGKFSVRKIIIN